MRISINMTSDNSIVLPINQNYYLASTVYKTLAAQPDYADFLHDHGYFHESSGHSFKLFVFSPLCCRNRKIAGDNISLGPGKIMWSISSPMPEFLTAIAEGLLSEGMIDICSNKLVIDNIMAEPEPLFVPEMRFSCQSPLVVSRPGSQGGHAEYLLHDDREFSDRVRTNLIRKYELIYGSPPQDNVFEMFFDKDYIARKDGKVTKLIDIKGTKIRGVFAPFSARGSVDLLKVGYEAGVGSYGSMGFGCVDVRE